MGFGTRYGSDKGWPPWNDWVLIDYEHSSRRIRPDNWAYLRMTGAALAQQVWDEAETPIFISPPYPSRLITGERRPETCPYLEALRFNGLCCIGPECVNLGFVG